MLSGGGGALWLVWLSVLLGVTLWKLGSERVCVRNGRIVGGFGGDDSSEVLVSMGVKPGEKVDQRLLL